MKRIMAVVLAVMLVVCSVAFCDLTASADYTVGDFTYTVANGEATITGYIGDGGDVTIPAKLGGYPVTAIGESAFEFNWNLESIIIPTGVTRIADYAFYSCEYLRSVVIPDGVVSIGDETFAFCRELYSVTLPASVTSIGEDGFFCCDALTKVYYGGSKADKDKIVYRYDNSALFNAAWEYNCVTTTMPTVTSTKKPTAKPTTLPTSAPKPEEVYNYTVTNGEATITEYVGEGGDLVVPETLGGYTVSSLGKSAFVWASSHITSITIPAGVTDIASSYAFDGLNYLTAIKVNEGNTEYASQNGVLFNKNKTTLIKYPESKPGAYTVPDSVSTIDTGAFVLCELLETVTLPQNITNINAGAFQLCKNLTDVYYQGSEAARARIIIGDYNGNLSDATWHYTLDSLPTTKPTGMPATAPTTVKTTAIKPTSIAPTTAKITTTSTKKPTTKPTAMPTPAPSTEAATTILTTMPTVAPTSQPSQSETVSQVGGADGPESVSLTAKLLPPLIIGAVGVTAGATVIIIKKKK